MTAGKQGENPKRSRKGRRDAESSAATHTPTTVPAGSKYEKQPCHNCARFNHLRKDCNQPIQRCTECGLLHHMTKFCNDTYKAKAKSLGFSAQKPQTKPTPGLGKSQNFAFLLTVRPAVPAPTKFAPVDKRPKPPTVGGSAEPQPPRDDYNSKLPAESESKREVEDPYAVSGLEDDDGLGEDTPSDHQPAETADTLEGEPQDDREWAHAAIGAVSPTIRPDGQVARLASAGKRWEVTAAYHYPVPPVAYEGHMGYDPAFPPSAETITKITPDVTTQDPMNNLIRLERGPLVEAYLAELNRVLESWDNIRKVAGMPERGQATPVAAKAPTLLSHREIRSIQRAEELDMRSTPARSMMTARDHLEHEQARAVTRDVRDWRHLYPRERRQQFSVLTEPPLHGYTSHEQMCDWLYWFPNWGPEERAESRLPESHLPIGEMIPPALLIPLQVDRYQ